jgi:tetratricopeptide (TPR) repeat protein
LLEFCIETSTRLFGFEHHLTQDVVTTLAYSFKEIGQYQKALSLSENIRDISQRNLGSNHPDSIGDVNLVAQCLHDLHRYDEALPMYMECLHLTRQMYGDDHPDSLSYANNVANLYQDKDLFDHALPIHLSVLEACKRVHGDFHPETFIMMHNLAGDVFFFHLWLDVADIVSRMLLGQGQLEESHALIRSLLGWSQANFRRRTPRRVFDHGIDWRLLVTERPIRQSTYYLRKLLGH